MDKKERTYLDMEREVPTLESGRYNTDFGLVNQGKQQSLFDSFRKLAFGADFNLPAYASLSTTHQDD